MSEINEKDQEMEQNEMNQESNQNSADQEPTKADYAKGFGMFGAVAAAGFAAGIGIRHAVNRHKAFKAWEKEHPEEKKVKEKKPKKHFHIGFVTEDQYQALAQTEQKPEEKKVNKK